MDYRWVKLLGQGGFGQVHEVANRNLPGSAPHIALKLFKVRHDDDDDEATQQRITRATREMRHHQRAANASEFVVNMYSWGQIDESFLFVSMELCTGGDVKKRLGEIVAGSDLRLKLYLQISRGVEAIHEAGLIHMDLKPENGAPLT